MSREVTLSNFNLKCKEIEEILENAKFVSLDTEMTGFASGNDNIKKFGSFDTSEELYLKVKKNIKPFIIMQLGLTAFCYDRECSKYVAYSYLFYVYPRSILSLQKTFLVQASVLEFLSQTSFDMNKVVYKGVSCLNLAEEAELRNNVQSLGQLASEDIIPREEQEEIEKQCTALSHWVKEAKDGSEWKVVNFDYSRKLLVFLLLKKIEERFMGVWPFMGDDDLIIVRKISDHERGRLLGEAIKHNIFENDLIEHSVGVSRIWKYLSKMQKPIVLSNPLYDLMMLYQQFQNPLPSSYQAFKDELHSVFPHIYDVKHIGYVVREGCHQRGIPLDDVNGLSILETYFRLGRGAELPSADPPVELAVSVREIPSTIDQDPGWDSYYSGCCLLRMAHFLAEQNKYGCGSSELPPDMTFPRLLYVGIKPYKNRIHIATANVSYMCLDGPDPVPDKPRTLLLTSKSQFATNAEWISEDLSVATRQTVQVRMTSDKDAVVVVNSSHAAEQVTRWCANRWDYEVRYHKEAKVWRWLLMGSALGLTCALAVKLCRSLK